MGDSKGCEWSGWEDLGVCCPLLYPLDFWHLAKTRRNSWYPIVTFKSFSWREWKHPIWALIFNTFLINAQTRVVPLPSLFISYTCSGYLLRRYQLILQNHRRTRTDSGSWYVHTPPPHSLLIIMNDLDFELRTELDKFVKAKESAHW